MISFPIENFGIKTKKSERKRKRKKEKKYHIIDGELFLNVKTNICLKIFYQTLK